MNYHAYNLIIDSSIPLVPLHEAGAGENVDVVIEQGAVSAEGILAPRFSQQHIQVGDDTVWLDVTEVARFLIEKGKRVTMAPYPEADEDTLKLYVLGSCMGAILHQRGNLVLHANAIRIDDGVILFAGESGAGKSTTAAVFHQKGYQVIADDVVAIDQQELVIGGIPQIKLWDDALQQLDIGKDGLELIRYQVEKYSFPIERYNDEPLPVKAIYFLDPSADSVQQQIEFHPLEGMEKFNYLKANTYQSEFMEGMGLKRKHLELCGKIANHVTAARIVRPVGEFNAVELADQVLQQLKEG